ncbi:glycosyltransferase [uncultured Secundilactobacillus sp.]|uniref:glycosyltransferase n=1 Tax=uncultured Secundilactobacillus sp. TaxID=2813935 RepID=UPI00258B36C3|nr:glycosyltransferase [uncultured Secundilactobacillus sp.]
MMNYFVLENLFTFNSGTEHATIKRTQLFNQSGLPAKIVTRNYNRFLDNDRDKTGLSAADVVNMYDYFQGTVNVTRVPRPLRLLQQFPLDEYHIVAEDANVSWLKKAGRNIARIEVMPATVGIVNTVTYYDRFDNPTVRENFDWRGFKSSVDYFHPNGELARQRFLNLSGQTVLEITHMNISGQVSPTMWKLVNYKGHNYRFNFEDQLFLFFLNELSSADPQASFISDRRNLDYVVADMNASSKWAFLHDTHLTQPSKATSELLPAYVTVLETSSDKFTGILVLTDAQKAQLNERYPDLPVQVVADTFVTDEMLKRGEKRVRKPIILVSGRVAPDKRPEDAISIFKKVYEAIPETKLRFIGYPASAEYETELKDQVKKAGIEAAVEFAGYKTGDDLSREYEEAQVLLNTSSHEGLGMHLIEAQAAGLPVVSYNVPYGPAVLVKNGVNGVLAPTGNQSALAEALIDLFNDDDQWLSMHKSALEKAQGYSAGNAIKTFKGVVARSGVGV